MKMIVKVAFVLFVLGAAYSCTPGSANRKADPKLLAEARRMLGYKVDVPIEKDTEKYCDVGFGEGAQLLVVGSGPDNGDQTENPIFLFGRIKGKVEKVQFDEYYGDILPAISIISFPEGKDLILIGGSSRTYESSANLYTCVDGKMKMVLQYDYFARQPSVGDTLDTDIRISGKRDLIVSSKKTDYASNNGSLEPSSIVQTEQVYVWDSSKKTYSASGKPAVISVTKTPFGNSEE